MTTQRPPGTSPSPASAATLDLAAASHEIANEDLFTLSRPAGIAASPNGNRIAYCESGWSDGVATYSLQVFDVGARASRELYRGTDPIYAPQWFTDSRLLVFAVATNPQAHSPGACQIWQVAPDQGKPTAVTEPDFNVARFQFVPADETIYFTRHQESGAGDRKWHGLRTRFAGAVEAGNQTRKKSQLWCLDLATGTPQLVHEHSQYITSFSVSPDARTVALITAPDERLITNEGQSSIEILDLESDRLTPVADSLWRSEGEPPCSWINAPAWSPDSSRLAFLIDSDAHPPEIIVAEVAAGAAAPRKIPRPLECHPLQITWDATGSHLLFTAEHRATIPLFALDPNQPGEFTTLVDGDRCVFDFSTAESAGSTFVIYSTESEFPQIGALDGSGGVRALTQLSPHTANWEFPRLSRYHWTAPDSPPIEGILELPPGHEPGTAPLPLIVNLHGGPNTASLFTREADTKGKTFLATAGFAVLHANFRGSAGYGDAFLEGLIGHMNEVDVSDVLAGIDALIADGIADPERLGVMGWSYGGYLTNCLIATGRFKAASTGAGAIDLGMQFAEMDTPGHTIGLSGGHPWEKPGDYVSRSPLYCFRRGLRTATLIHSGGRDRRVPPNHSLALHRVLDHYLDAPCELVVYPEAGHQLTTRDQQLAKLEWDLSWFQTHLNGATP